MFRPMEEWYAEAPALVADCVELWRLQLGRTLDAYTALVYEARTESGDDVVLKVGFRDRETESEADALAAWDGCGAVRLLSRDAERHALLLERCVPGTPLSSEPEVTL